MWTILKIFGILIITGFIIGILAVVKEFIFPNSVERKQRKAGTQFENLTAKLLRKKSGFKPVQNILLKRGDGSKYETTEIDMAWVTRKGIFVVECKRRGRDCSLIADPTQHMWYLSGAGPDNTDMPNPFEQNDMHIEELKRHIGQKVMFNLVAVSVDFTMKFNGNIYSNKGNDCFDAFTTGYKRGLIKVDPDLSIFQTGVKNLIKGLKRLPDVYTEDEVKEIIEELKKYEGTKEELQKHKEQFAGK